MEKLLAQQRPAHSKCTDSVALFVRKTSIKNNEKHLMTSSHRQEGRLIHPLPRPMLALFFFLKNGVAVERLSTTNY